MLRIIKSPRHQAYLRRFNYLFERILETLVKMWLEKALDACANEGVTNLCGGGRGGLILYYTDKAWKSSRRMRKWGGNWFLGGINNVLHILECGHYVNIRVWEKRTRVNLIMPMSWENPPAVLGNPLSLCCIETVWFLQSNPPSMKNMMKVTRKVACRVQIWKKNILSK